MSKQEAAMAILEYLTEHAHKKAPATREIRVTGDDEGSWFVEFAYADGESRHGKGADFAEALAAALRAGIY